MTTWHNKRRQARKEAGVCTDCGEPRNSTGLMCLDCKAHARKLAAKSRKPYRKRTKDAAFTAYGGYKCACPGCNITTEQFLSIDYIDNTEGGHKPSTGTGHSFYLWLKKYRYPIGFRVLCHNCNLGRQLNKGICPCDSTHHV